MKTPITDYLREYFLSADSPRTNAARPRTAAKIVLANVRKMELETIKNFTENKKLLEARRERDRLRKQRHRARVCPRTEKKTPLISDSKLEEGTLDKKESLLTLPVIEATIVPRQKRGERLPADWTPTARHRSLAESLGRDERWMNGCADDMRDWAKANGHRQVTRKSDWDATFSGWLRREAAKRPQNRRSGPSLSDIARGQFDFGDQR